MRGVGWSVASLSLCVCMSVCPYSKRKTALAINAKLATRIPYSIGSACIDPEVKRLNVKVTRLWKPLRYVAWLLRPLCCCCRRGTACRLTAQVSSYGTLQVSRWRYMFITPVLVTYTHVVWMVLQTRCWRYLLPSSRPKPRVMIAI